MCSQLLRGVPSVVIFCKAFLKCSTGRWADTAATAQSNWLMELQNKTKQNITIYDLADATQCSGLRSALATVAVPVGRASASGRGVHDGRGRRRREGLFVAGEILHF